MTTDCLEGMALAASWHLKGILLLKTIAAFIGTIVPVAAFSHQGLSWLCHVNGKILFVNHILSTVSVPVAFVCINLYDLFRSAEFSFIFFSRLSQRHPDSCDLLSTAKEIRFFSLFGLSMQVFSILAFCCERMISTRCPSQYERKPQALIGISIVFLSNSLAFLISFSMIMNEKDREDFSQLMTASFLALIQISSLLIMWYALKRNIQKYKQTPRPICHLSRKYQLRENRRILDHLLPAATVHFALLSLYVVGFCFFKILFNTYMTPLQQRIGLEITDCMILYSIISPLVLHFKCSQWKEPFMPSVTTTSEHFATLREQFNRTLPSLPYIM